MIRPVLLAALVVCSAGVGFVAVQPAAGDVLSETPGPDGSNESDPGSGDRETPDDSDDDRYDDDSDDDEQRWYDRWESDDEERTDHDENRSDDRNRSVGGDADRNGTDEPEERSRNGTAGGNATGENATTGGNATTDGDGHADAKEESNEDDRRNRSVIATLPLNTTERVLSLPLNTTERVLDAADGTVEGVIDGSTVALPFEERDAGSEVDRPAVDNASGAAADGGAAAGYTAGDEGPVLSPPSADDVAAPVARAEASDSSDDSGGDGGDGGAPAGSPAGSGAALVVTVGCLGWSRVGVTQANLLASPGVEGTVASLRRIAGDTLAWLSDRVVPPVFGYSRHDSSDPLENETRAAIYDLVSECPGIYHARLAEETGVAVETVRYHSRILAEEGLVEPRKHRGKRRLYPVSMDDDDPELAAAIADSAAADVLSAIERLEPATLSAVAEDVGCAPSTVAYHLDRLEEDGLVSRERDGGAVEVRLRRSTRSALQGTVADD